MGRSEAGQPANSAVAVVEKLVWPLRVPIDDALHRAGKGNEADATVRKASKPCCAVRCGAVQCGVVLLLHPRKNSAGSQAQEKREADGPMTGKGNECVRLVACKLAASCLGLNFGPSLCR